MHVVADAREASCELMNLPVNAVTHVWWIGLGQKAKCLPSAVWNQSLEWKERLPAAIQLVSIRQLTAPRKASVQAIFQRTIDFLLKTGEIELACLSFGNMMFEISPQLPRIVQSHRKRFQKVMMTMRIHD